MQKRSVGFILPEELRKVGSFPLNIEWTSWEDDQSADNCQTRDGEHQTANLSFEQKQHLRERETTRANTTSYTALMCVSLFGYMIGKEESHIWSALDSKIQKPIL